jgi:hypothetical protein
MRTPLNASLVSSFVAASALVACGGGNATGPTPDVPPTSTAIQGVTPSRNLHLRAAFDDNPSIYVGRFVPADVKGAELDENRASQTVCSKHFKVNEVTASQDMDELVYSSSSSSAALGVAAPGALVNAKGERQSGGVLRVHYKISKKIQVVAEPDGLSACCAKNPGACTNLVVGEFLRGSGEIYASTTSAKSASGDVAVPPVAAQASYTDSSQWRKVQSFDNTFFAFLPVATGIVDKGAADLAAKEAKDFDKSCGFCDRLPKSDEGVYFCGISAPSPEEQAGRDNAMQNARQQVVRYLGERIETNSKALSTTAKGLVTDERYTTAVAKGLAQWVKDEKHCSEKENSPERRSVHKVLTFVPNQALADSAQKALDEVAAAKGATLSEKDKTAAKDAVKKATTR